MERTQQIKELRNKNWSWNAIGVAFGISRARAHQIGSGYKNKETKKYQEIIFQRDNYTCQFPLCQRNGTKLLIHHLDHNDKNNDLNNLITICDRCHCFIHQYKLKQCKNCEKEIENKPNNYCDTKCILEYNDKRWVKVCSKCGKSFMVKRESRVMYYRKGNKKPICSECSPYHRNKLDN